LPARLAVGVGILLREGERQIPSPETVAEILPMDLHHPLDLPAKRIDE
jgi:hypothetical protein